MIYIHFQSSNHFFSYTLFIILLFLDIPCSVSLNFSLHNFSSNDGNINYERDAFAANNAIQLTSNQRDVSMVTSIGRAAYFKPMYLYNNVTRNLTDFNTHFSFIINSLNASSYGDGFAFFLAPNGSSVPPNAKEGGAFGLTNDDQPVNNTVNHFVAVEFDIFKNYPGWDPENSNEHIGIDINSVKSVANSSWVAANNSIMNGWKNEAWISYDSSSKNLSVVLGTNLDGNSKTVNQSLSYIVDLRDYLPEWITFGFSAATGRALAIHTVVFWEFNSSIVSDENAKSPIVVGLAVGLVVGLVVGGVFVCGCGFGLFVIWRKRKRQENEEDDGLDDSMDNEFERGAGPKKFSYKALAQATNNFSQQEKLGEGGFGGVYRGFLRELDAYVAVKRVSRGSRQGIKEYASEVRIISRLGHKNLVKLMGWCHENRELLLVYEYMPNGSLDAHLFKGKSLLSWGVRYRIAQGLATALQYLHEEWEQCVVHRDIKSSNIMLDSSFNTKLGDFGLARLVDHEKGAQTTVMAGTMGYMAPECCITGQASKGSDVFSFGVVALEIACGRKSIEPNADESKIRLVDWVWDLYGTQKLLEAADSKLSGEFDEQEMKRLMIVGLSCAHPDSTLRPSMKEAIQVLNFKAPLPMLPSKMPVATYLTPVYAATASLSVAKSATTFSDGSQTLSSNYSNNTDSSISSPSASLLYNTWTRL